MSTTSKTMRECLLGNYHSSMMPLAQLRKLRPEPFFVIPGLSTEHGQAVARLCWGPIFAIYLCLNNRFSGNAQYLAAWILVAVQFVFALATWYLIRKNYGPTHLRVVASTILDQMLFAATLYLTDEIAAPFVLMPMLFAFGSGLRYGRRYAILSKTLCSTLTCAVLMYSPYWSQYPAIRDGLMVAAVLFPFYVFRLTDALALKMRTDSMTGLRNRVSFDELLSDVCHGAPAAKRDSAIVLLDLDGFKQINDSQGHDGGDSVLKHVGYWLSVELSPLGVPARFGGDEFAVIVCELSSRDELEEALGRFLKRTAEVGELFNSPLGASIGVYYIEPGSATTCRFAYKAADQLMYRAKKQGKNQFVTSANRNFAKNGELIEPSAPRPAAQKAAAATAHPAYLDDQLDNLVRLQL